MSKFQPGKSGNPSGRPVRSPALKAALKKLGTRSLEVLEHLMNSAEDESIRFQAAKYLCDQAHGKPTESVELTGEGGGPLIAKIVDG